MPTEPLYLQGDAGYISEDKTISGPLLLWWSGGSSAAVEGLHPDVILLDLALPGLDGFETARLVRSKAWQPRLLIALSGYSQDEDEQRAEEAGFDDFLVKPFDLPVLTNLLTRDRSAMTLGYRNLKRENQIASSRFSLW